MTGVALLPYNAVTVPSLPPGGRRCFTWVGGHSGVSTMMHSLEQAATMRESPVRLAPVILAWAACAAWGSALPAQSPPMRSEEIMRQWDLNHDGKIDDGEAEVARAKMRRARNEAPRKEEIDPVTGRPRAAAGAAAGRGLPPAVTSGAPAVGPAVVSAGDDGGLILVPGTGEPPPSAGPMLAEPAAPPPARERDPLPGTRAPAVTTTIPAVPTPNGLPGDSRTRAGLTPPATGRDPRSGELSSRARILPDGSTVPTPPPSTARRSASTTTPPALPRPGVIAGGSRPPAGASSQGLNAGRLPGGLPQTRGVAPGGTAPYARGPTNAGANLAPAQPYAAQPYGGAAGSRGTSARVPVPLGGMPSNSGGVRGPMTPQQPSTTAARSGLRPQVTQPSLPRAQPTSPAVPRPPRVGPEDYFGR